MNIDEIITEFKGLYDYPGTFRFNTPVYEKVHKDITEFIYKTHFEKTVEWKTISDNLLYRSCQTMSLQQADIIVVQLEKLKRRVLIQENEAFWEYIHPKIKVLVFEKFIGKHYADCVETAFKEINSRLKEIYKKQKGEEKDGASLMTSIFSPENPILCFENIDTQNGKNVQLGYMRIFEGTMLGIRNPKAHANMSINKDSAIKRLVLAGLLMDKIDEAIKNTGIKE